MRDNALNCLRADIFGFRCLWGIGQLIGLMIFLVAWLLVVWVDDIDDC